MVDSAQGKAIFAFGVACLPFAFSKNRESRGGAGGASWRARAGPAALPRPPQTKPSPGLAISARSAQGPSPAFEPAPAREHPQAWVSDEGFLSQGPETPGCGAPAHSLAFVLGAPRSQTSPRLPQPSPLGEVPGPAVQTFQRPRCLKTFTF